jgi:hypothetical protein
MAGDSGPSCCVNVEMIQACAADVDEQTKEAHQVQAVSLLGNEVGQVKKVTYHFPGKTMTCNNKACNNEAPGVVGLMPKVCFVNAVTVKRGDGKEITFTSSGRW